MPDSPDSPEAAESPLPPEQDAVRRLLADARHDGPPPPQVVARLDETLASLVAERRAGGDASPRTSRDPSDTGADTGTSPVVDLGARRRRLAGVGLLAAAAVVVAGVGLGQVLPRGGDDAGAGDSASQADSAAGGAEAPDDSSAGAELAPESLKNTEATPFSGLPSLSTTEPGLDQQLVALRSEATSSRQALGSLDAIGCDPTPLGGSAPGRRVAVQVDGAVGVVVFRRPDGSSQQAEVYVCGAPEPVRTVTLPAP